MYKRLRLSFILLLIILAGLTGMSSLAQEQNQRIIRLGMLLTPGSEGDLGARLAVQELNQTQLTDPFGRAYRLELIYPNFQPTSAGDIPRALQILVGQEARAIIGPLNTDFALPNLEPLARAGVPVLTLATADSLTDVDVTNNITRMRAPESHYSFAMMDYMVNQLGLTEIALIQTDIESTEGLVAFEIALAEI